jgi:16S rRNA (cytosine1402-N4)-methyltransferase
LISEHQPVLCEETVNLVVAEPQACEDLDSVEHIYVDATYGRGGHSRALLARLPATARLIAIDRDVAAIAVGQDHAAEDSRLTICHGRFSQLDPVLDDLGISHVTGVIMDLGVSSPQLDAAERGFSFRADGPLDMRMDQTQGETAAQWLNSAAVDEIVHVLKTLGEERYARRIARAIVAARPLNSTLELAEIVSRAQPRRPRSNKPGRTKHDATRAFQAVRMHVNDELGELESAVQTLFDRLLPGGRLAIITFHSLEDRTVKQSFRRLAGGMPLPRRLPVRESERPQPGKVVGKPIRASAAEVAENPRARSATLRVLERLA